jgi:hypothetical protein
MTDDVELNLPAEADLVVLARLTAATIASRAGFDVEEIEDLRLAVDELCLSLIGSRVVGRIDLRFTYDDDCIEVACRHRADHLPEVGSDDDSSLALSALMLDALVDEHGEHEAAGLRSAWLRKRRMPRPD